MARSAHHKQSAKGVLSMGSGAHDRQRSGVIPAQLSQIDRIVASEFAPFYVFYLLPDTFLGKNFSHVDLAGA